MTETHSEGNHSEGNHSEGNHSEGNTSKATHFNDPSRYQIYRLCHGNKEDVGVGFITQQNVQYRDLNMKCKGSYTRSKVL